jgi:hypothetical protein
VTLDRPQVVQPFGSFLTFYGTRRFITEFTRAFHLCLSWTRPIQSTTLNPISKRFILMLSIYLHLGLPSGLFPSDFPTNNLYTFLFSSIRATYPAHKIWIWTNQEWFNSEELSASFISVTRIGGVGTTLAVTNNRRSLRLLLVTANVVPSSLILSSWNVGSYKSHTA